MTFSDITSLVKKFDHGNYLTFEKAFSGANLSQEDKTIIEAYLIKEELVAPNPHEQDEDIFTLSIKGHEFVSSVAHYRDLDRIFEYINAVEDMQSIQAICKSLGIPWSAYFESQLRHDELLRLGHSHNNVNFYLISERGRIWWHTYGGYQSRLVKEVTEKGSKHLLSMRTSKKPMPTFWKKGCVKVFISHITEYKKVAGELKEALELIGISAFVAHDDIKPSKRWEEELELGLSTCDALIALLHKGFNRSDWTNQEIGFAICRQIPILTIDIGERPKGFSSKFQSLKYIESPKDLSFRIVQTILENDSTSKEMSRSITYALKDSKGFAQSIAISKLLQHIPQLDEKMRQALTDAKANGQVSRANGVVREIDTILNR